MTTASAPVVPEPDLTPPRVWVLLGKGVGGNRQMRTLAEALGWPFEEKQLAFNALERMPTLLLGASVRTVDRRRSTPLAPPWPDLVIAASRRSAPVALWIRRQSSGRARLVHLLHAQAPLHWFDLLVTLPQYRLPRAPNVMHAVAPLVRLDAAALAAAGATWAPRLAALPRPRSALLVGGDSSSYAFDATTAARLARAASAHAQRTGGSLLVSTSARTSAAAAAALAANFECPAHIYRWRRDDSENPYLAYLALGDDFIVTVDSASLLAEACAAGRPVFLFDWPPRPRRGLAFRGALAWWSAAAEAARQAHAGSQRAPGVVLRLWDRLVYLGLVKPPRDFDAYHRELLARGLVTRLGETPRASSAGAFDDLERAVDRIRRRFRSEPLPAAASSPHS
jgi:hypothetical protein